MFALPDVERGNRLYGDGNIVEEYGVAALYAFGQLGAVYGLHDCEIAHEPVARDAVIPDVLARGIMSGLTCGAYAAVLLGMNEYTVAAFQIADAFAGFDDHAAARSSGYYRQFGGRFGSVRHYIRPGYQTVSYLDFYLPRTDRFAR